MCFAWQTLWLVLKLCDWMLEWQCAKFTQSAKQHFEMEWNPSTAHYPKQESNESYPVPESGGFSPDAAVPPARRQQTEQFVAGVMGVFYNPEGFL